MDSEENGDLKIWSENIKEEIESIKKYPLKWKNRWIAVGGGDDDDGNGMTIHNWGKEPWWRRILFFSNKNDGKIQWKWT